MGEHPVAGWYADPTGRFEHRYWDGERWTEHVARQGQATTDALDGSTVHDTATLDLSRDRGWSPDTGTGAAGPQVDDAAPWHDGAPVRRTNVKAVLSLVASLVWLGGLASLAGVILGVMAKRELRDRPDESGGALATAGIVLGVLGILLTLLVLGAILAFVSFGSSSGGEMIVTPFEP